jgi:hypothetical protein
LGAADRIAADRIAAAAEGSRQEEVRHTAVERRIVEEHRTVERRRTVGSIRHKVAAVHHMVELEELHYTAVAGVHRMAAGCIRTAAGRRWDRVGTQDEGCNHLVVDKAAVAAAAVVAAAAAESSLAGSCCMPWLWTDVRPV